MKKTTTARRPAPGRKLAKSPTGIPGLDQLTGGGLPKGRTTLIAGGPGSGKTLIAMQFLMNGILQFGEPGVFIAFEETSQELEVNMTSVGYDVAEAVSGGKLTIDHVIVERRQIEEAGEFELEGLFIRLDHAIKTIKAKRVVLDSLEVLFTGFQNLAIIRSELRRLFHWLKDKGVTAIITAESGSGSLTRHGLEEYVSDCVIALDHRVTEQVSTRRLRVLKYRGSAHGTNEYPFLMSDRGIAVVPITSLGLTHIASSERVSSGVEGLDHMLDVKGYFRGSSVLLSGSAGTGKSSVAACFVDAACRRGEKALYFAFEESPSQIIRNMRSVGLDLEQWTKNGLLEIHATRPTSLGLESHLAQMYRMIEDLRPDVVAVDPITNLITAGDPFAVKAMLTRLIDHLKSLEITALFTNLTWQESTDDTLVGVSSLMDTWISIRDIDDGIERHRELRVLKSRGMAHSSKSEVLSISSEGLQLVEASSV